MEKNELSTTTTGTVNNNNCQKIQKYAPGTNSSAVTAGLILPITRDSRGPRSLYLRRHGNTYGFTLRHFIVYPPDAITEDDGRHAACGALQQPMDTIFVKSVRDGSSAQRAGLRRGDRLLAVNGHATNGGENTYQRVVQLIAASAEFLHLLVVPKEEDVLQRFFPDTAYNPVTNRTSATQFLTQHLATTTSHATTAPSIICRDLASWQQLLLQQQHHVAPSSSESEIYAEISQQNGGGATLRNKLQQQRAATATGGAQPQVPIYQKQNKKIINRRVSLTADVHHMSNNNNFDSCSSSLYYYDNDAADVNNDSLRRGSLSLSNTSTTLLQDGGNDIDNGDVTLSSLSSSLEFMQDSARLTRMRQCQRQKEAFLLSKTAAAAAAAAPPVVKTEGLFKEFHPRAERVRIDQPIWPPSTNGSGLTLIKGDAHKMATPPSTNQKRETLKLITGNKEMGVAGAGEESAVLMVKRGVAISPPLLQNVQKRAKKFDDSGDVTAIAENDRTMTQQLTGSELSRLTKLVLMPNVTERAHEYDRKSTTMMTTKKTEINRLEPETLTEKKPQPEIARSEPETGGDGGGYLTGNVIMTTGSKYIHCPPPGVTNSMMTDGDSCCNNDRFLLLERERSNSADSWMTAVGDDLSKIDSCCSEIDNDFQPQRPARGRYSLLDTTNNVATTQCAVVMRRTKKKFGSDTKRPESYLRATKSDICQDDLTVDMDDSSSAAQNFSSTKKKYQPSPFYGEIEQLRQLFEEKQKNVNSKENVEVIKETAVNLKVLEIDGRRATDRSWKPAQMIFVTEGVKKKLLFVNASTHSPLSPELDVRNKMTRISVADDYTKRKNVLRISHAHNYEFLVQIIVDGNTATSSCEEWFDILTTAAAVNNNNVKKRQKAEPQHSAAKMSILVPPPNSTNMATPPPNKSGSDLTINQNNSPTKSASKTWRGRVVKQLKKFNTQVGGATTLGHASHHQNNNNNNNNHAHNMQHLEEGLTFGVPLDQCQMSIKEAGLPKFVELCTEMIESKGLNVIGIYRVPGNNAAITALTNEVNNRTFIEDGATITTTTTTSTEDSRWNDVHVISSLLKSFLRKMPDSLVTSQLYPEFIKVDKYCSDPRMRMRELKRLLRQLPHANYVTLRHVMRHLKRVADACAVNRMEVKNLAIVFGPTIIRPQCETMESMVSNMTFQCKILESLITHCDWFFSADVDALDDDNDSENDIIQDDDVIMSSIKCQQTVNNNNNNNNQVLLDNISKYEALKEQKEKNGALLTSLFSAAQRKVMRKSQPQHLSTRHQNCQTTSSAAAAAAAVAVKNLTEVEKTSAINAVPQSPPPKENLTATVNNQQQQQQLSTATTVNNVTKQPWFNYKTDQSDFSRRIEIFKQETEAMLQQPRNIAELSLISGGNLRPQSLGGGDNIQDGAISRVGGAKSSSGRSLRRGSSAENLTCVKSAAAVAVKKSLNKYDSSSNDSLVSSKFLTEDEESLLSTMTKLIDEKLKEPATALQQQQTTTTAEMSNSTSKVSKFNDPSLHRLNNSIKEEKTKKISEKMTENDEKRGVVSAKINNCQETTKSLLLRRSESLKNRIATPLLHVNTTTTLVTPTQDVAPPTQPNKPLKRSVSLTKTEKTDLNLTKRRELMKNRHHINNNLNKTKTLNQSEKHRCSIKRRHTVGGTKDPDKLTYLIITNNNNNNEATPPNNNNNDDDTLIDIVNRTRNVKNDNHRASSPDLIQSVTTSQQLFFEINFFDRYDNNNDRRRRQQQQHHHVVDNDITLTLRHHVVASSIDANNLATPTTSSITTTPTTTTTLESHV